MTLLAPKPEQISGLWTADQFLDFTLSRPDEERWQLVDGLAMMMAPASFDHQKISKRIVNLLNSALSANRPDLEAFYEMGVRIPGRNNFNPTPDVIVLRADASFQRYADRFFFVAEITSPSNTEEMIERKMELYRSHPDNLYCLKVHQDRIYVALYAREAGWERQELSALAERLVLPAFGLETTLAEIYKGVTSVR